jgi:hypothetical protein
MSVELHEQIIILLLLIVEIWHTDSLTDCLFARIFKRKNLSCWAVSGSELFPRIWWVFFSFWPDLLVTQQCFSSTKSCIYYPFYLWKGQLLAKEKLSWKSILYVDAKPKLMVHVETWKDRISVHIYSVFVLVTRVWVYCWIFSKQNSSVLCTHVLVASHWAVTRYMLVTQNVAFLQRLLQLQFPRDLFDLVVFLWWVINFVRITALHST